MSTRSPDRFNTEMALAFAGCPSTLITDVAVQISRQGRYAFRFHRLLRPANAIVKQIRRGVLPPSHPSARIYPQVGEGVWRIRSQPERFGIAEAALFLASAIGITGYLPNTLRRIGVGFEALGTAIKNLAPR